MKQTSSSLIDKYLVLTLPRSVRRQWAMFGNLLSQRVPLEKIKFIPSIDGENYDNMQAVADAAAEDGYPFLQQFGVGLKGAYVKQSKGNMALFWMWAKTLKYIAKSGHICVLSWDDRFLMIPYPILEKIVGELYSPDFYALQLRLRAPRGHLEVLGYTAHRPRDVDGEITAEDNARDDEIHTDLFYSTIHGTVNSYYDLYLSRGILGYDETMVLSPDGAKWLLTEMLTMQDLTHHLLDFNFDETQEDGLTSENVQALERARLNNDNYLCWDKKLRTAIDEAVAAGKGLYHPRHPAYTFIDEPIEQGSDVHWSTDETFVLNIEKIPFMEI